MLVEYINSKGNLFSKIQSKNRASNIAVLGRQIGEGGGCFVPAPFKVKEEGMCV